MVTLQKSGDSAVKFVFTDSDHYLYGSGQLETPVNSLLLVLDESEMVTFKKLSGDPFLSFRADNSNLGTKAAIEQFYKDNMVGSSGSGSGVTSGDVETMIDAALDDYYDKDEVDAGFDSVNATLSGKADTAVVNQAISEVTQSILSVSGDVQTKLETSDFNTYSATTEARLDEDEQVTAAALNDLQENKADTSAVTQSLSAKQDALVYYTEDTSNESATIMVQNDDGLGNRSENRVFVDGDIIIESYNETDDGEGNTGTTDTQVDINSLGLSIITYSDDGIDTTQTELKVQPMGAYINSEPIATEPYVDAAITGKVDTSAITTAITSGSTDDEIPTAKAVYDATQGGGGATYSAGTNISIDTANTINCTLPITANSGNKNVTVGYDLNVREEGETSIGKYNVNRYRNALTHSENTIFTVGNGGSNGLRHNALEIRKNGDLYFADTSNGGQYYYEKPMVRLQDMYAALGGLKLVSLTQSEYDNLATKDANTLYIINNVVS